MEPLDLIPFRLGGWLVDPQDGTLRSGDVSRRLEPQVMDLLVFLASRSGGVVSKQEILDQIWKGSAVSDDALTGAVYQLRKALGDEARRPRFIETIPKRGYRLLIPAEAPAAPASDTLTVESSRRWRWLAAVLAALVAAGAGAWWVAARDPVPAEAMEAYQKGHSLLSQHTPQALQQARVYFQRALQLHPQFPAASAGLAESIVLRLDIGLGVPAELAAEARAAALQALEADPDLAEAHSAYAAIVAAFDWDFPRAGKELRRALQLRPDLAEAHRRYAYVASTLGRREEAIRAARRALALDPLSLPAYRDVAEMLIMARRYDEAVLEVRKALELDPDDPGSLSKMATVYWLQGKEREGYAAYRRSLRAESLDPEVLARLDAVFAREGMQGVARSVAQYLESQPIEVPSLYAEMATLYAAAGERDRAFAALGRACDERLPNLPWLSASPYLDSLRADPRFAELLHRMRPPGAASRPAAGPLIPFPQLFFRKEPPFLQDSARPPALPSRQHLEVREEPVMKTIVKAVIGGSAVAMLGVMPWQGLVVLNLKQWPAVPWSVPVGLLWLWLYWRYLRGWGWPRPTAAARRASLRAHPLPSRVWRAALWAGGLAVAAMSAVEVFVMRFARVPRPVWFSEVDTLPAQTVISILLMIAFASGLIEEAAYRGYMQTMIERRHGPWVAIPVVAVVFTLIHLTTYPDMSLSFFLGLLTISVAYGLLAWLSGSILPGLILHATGDAVGLLALWSLRGTVRAPRFAETGPDRLFWLDLLAMMVLGGATVWAYRRLARVARGERQRTAIVDS